MSKESKFKEFLFTKENLAKVYTVYNDIPILQDFPICIEGWDGDAKIELFAKKATQFLVARGAKVIGVTLRMFPAYLYVGQVPYFAELKDSDRIKQYEVEFIYKTREVCYFEFDTAVWWKGVIKNGVEEGLFRCDNLDGAESTAKSGSRGQF